MRDVRIVLAAAVAAVLAAGPARAGYAKGQELVLLTAHSAVLAAQRCPYALDERRLAAFLSRKGLRRADLDAAGGYSELLRDDMAVDDARYQNDAAAACDQAWASFGPGSPVAGLLRRR